MSKIFIVSLFSVLFLINGSLVGQDVVAYDDASNYGGWTGNGGEGFGVWNLYTSGGNGGHFLEPSHDGLIDTDEVAFGMWGSDGYAHAERYFDQPLTTGRDFYMELSVHWRDGHRGIDLLTSTGDVLWNVNIHDGGYGDTGWGFAANSHISLTVAPVDKDYFQVFLQRRNAGFEAFWVSDYIAGQVAGFRAYAGETGGDPERNFFINTLRIITDGIIYFGDGLRMPGDWNGWINNTGMGGNFDMQRTLGGTNRWSTSFHYTGATGDQAFKFASTSFGDPWGNQWAGNTQVAVNTMSYFNGSGATLPDNNKVTLESGNWYTVVFHDKGYKDSRAILMETSDAPVSITSVTQVPVIVSDQDEVAVTAQLSAEPSPEEVFYLRYTTDGWQSSDAVAMVVTADQAAQTIPALASGTDVAYYVFSSVTSGLVADFDMHSIRINNNAGNNHTYTVDPQAVCDDLVLLTDPVFPRETMPITITLNASLGNKGLMDHTGDIYAHTGVITNLSNSSSDWRYVKTGWGDDTPETMLTKLDDNLYAFTIDDIRDYYGVDAGEEILQLAMIFRSENDGIDNYLIHRNADGSDFLVDVYEGGLNVKLLSPVERNVLIGSDRLISICAAALDNTSISVFINDDEVETIAASSLSVLLNLQHLSPGAHEVSVSAADGGGQTVTLTLPVYIRGPVSVAALPAHLPATDVNGIHYIDDETVTLVLHDPPGLKNFAFVIGDFNEWLMTDAHYMNRTPDGSRYWTTITGLTPGEEYAFQYLIDGNLRLADPYSEMVLDPWNDPWISPFNYPDLKPYPTEKTTGIVSVLQPGRLAYTWEVEEFVLPDVRDLVIYELHIRDFVETDAIKSVEEKLDYLEELGVNAIELMPVNQFEGNDSWGYNPAFYFATDKAYGAREDYKRFIDEAHSRGMAVILDVVMNHSFNLSPLVQMYFDPDAGDWGAPSYDNPWYLPACPHEPWCWGNTFDQDSPFTHELFERILRYWLTEFNIDGFRFDFTKGFTNVQSGNQGNDYDAARVANLKRIADQVWAVKPGAYVILEHLTGNDEEVELANYGMLIWGNMNHQYNETTMGYHADEGSDLSWGLHTSRGYAFHNLISYMESHDEERLMYKNLQYGNSDNPVHDVKDLEVALLRNAAAAAFYFVAPGPKMIWQFGELGYDFSINHCPDGSVDPDCRTSRKPIPWDPALDYLSVPARKQLFDTYARLIHLKTSHPVFRTGNINHSLGGELKRIHLNEHQDGSGMKVTLLGNFDVWSGNITPYFQETGTWYEYFSGDVLEVTDPQQQINLQPGEFRLYSSDHFDPVQITAAVNFGDYGSVTGAGTYDRGQTVTLTASAEPGYAFLYWTEAGVEVSSAFVYVFVADGDRELLARFYPEGMEENNIVNDVNVPDGTTLCFDAIKTIEVADLSVDPGGSASFVAEESIRLLPGVVVANGGYLHAAITFTGQFCPPVLKMMEAMEMEEVTSAADYATLAGQDKLFSVYPNPTTGMFNITLTDAVDATHMYVRVYNMLGGVVLSAKVEAGQEHSLSIQGQQPGIYIIRVSAGDRIGTTRLMKR